MENRLPYGWIEAPLAVCCDILDSVRIPVNSDERAKRLGDVPYYGATGQVGWIDDFLFNEEIILIGEDGAPFFDKSKAIAFIVNGRSWVNNHAHVLRAKAVTTNKYLTYFLNNFDFNGFVNGTTRLKLTQGRMKEIPVPLPPLAEQERIVTKLDSLLARVNNSKSRLERIPALLKNFRKSILTAAMKGELTKEWRQLNDDVQLAKTKKSKKLRRNVLDDKVDDYDLYELPAKWFWTTISDIADVKGGKRLPKGHELVSYDTGMPYIKAGDLKKGTVIKEKLEFLLPETQKLIKRYIVDKGDVYITNVGAKIGDAGIIPEDLHGANLTENALKMCNLEGVTNQFLSCWLRSPIAQSFIRQTILSAAQGKLALGRVEVFPIPLPPTEEQREIIRKIEELFHFADSIEARYQKANTWFEKIPQSLLAKAFRGELVPQDENDEPASVLLERITKEKNEKAVSVGKKNKKGSTPAKASNAA